MTGDELATIIVERIGELSASGASPCLVAISGVDCAGKSTLSRILRDCLAARAVAASVIGIDDFLIPERVKARRTPEHLGYFEDAFDYRALVDALPAAPHPVVVVEGVFVLREELRKRWTLTVWLDVDPALAMERALVRDLAHFGDAATVQRIYEARCRPAQAYHQQRDRPSTHADIVARFDGGEWSIIRTTAC